MASFVYKHSTFSHNGPRLGVYPLQQLEHYRAVSWRSSQLRQPESTYRQKLKTEPATILPGPPALPPRTLRRSSSAVSMGMQATPTKAASPIKESSFGPQFMVTTSSMTMQPRPPQKEKTTPTISKCSTISARDYPYLDPLQVKGDPKFEERLAEIARFEANTVKQEKGHKSKARPLSARGISKNPASRSVSVASSRPVSARSISVSTSSKLRKSSANSVSAPSTRGQPRPQSALAVKSSTIHIADIHNPKSATDLKQIHSRNTQVQSTPSDDTEVLPPKAPRVFLPETDKHDQEVREKKLPAIPLARPCIRSLSDSEDSKADSLNVTSDLGLSIDSLHLTGEDGDLPADCSDPITHTPVPDEHTVRPPVSFEITITPPRKKGGRNKRTKS